MGVSFDCELDDSGDVNSKFKGMKIDNLRFKDEDEVEFLFFFLKESRVFVWIFFFLHIECFDFVLQYFLEFAMLEFLKNSYEIL
jgi:hypothetical protein